MSTGQLPLIQITGTSTNFYEQCYVTCQPDSNGYISSIKAAELLKTSGLTDKILSEIWECSDSSSKGYLTKYDFHVALKLVALAQNKIEPKIQNLHMNVSIPRVNVTSPLSYNITNNSISPINVWSISPEEHNKYSIVFDSLDSLNGKLSGDAVKPVFINSKLPVAILGQIWTLSDIDKDGCLDRDEFTLAMHLIYKCLAGEEPLQTLPPNLVPPSKRRPSSSNSIQSSFRANTSASSLQSSFRLPPSDWIVGKLEKERYDCQFFSADMDKDGLVSGIDIKDTFVRSGLPQVVLAKIWDLCDVTKSGMLNSEQFALAMHMINDQISSAGTRPIPSSLSADMIPPSLRTKIATDLNAVDQLTLNSFGLKAESDDVYSEIDILRRERAQVEQMCRQYEADYKSQAQDVQELQETLDRIGQTAQALSKQKEEAQHRLDELTEQKNRIQVTLDETRAKCKDERDQLDALKRQIGNQSVSIEEKRDDLKRLQTELNDLIREEASLQEQVQQHHSRLVAIEQETSSTETHIVATEGRNDQLESLRSQLQAVMEQYDSVLATGGTSHGPMVPTVPDVATVDALLASDLVDKQATQPRSNEPWSNDDPFSKDDPFSSITDPFAGTTVNGGAYDPFAVSVDPFSSPDPFSGQDPFAGNNGWSTNVASTDQSTAFSMTDVDDLFKNIDIGNSSTNHNQFPQSNDIFGFGDSPFDSAPGKTLPPPRPTKAPNTIGNNAPVMMTGKSRTKTDNGALSEIDQMSWAKQESEREAREAEAVRRREQADFEMALKLSQAEYRTQERRKAGHRTTKK